MLGKLRRSLVRATAVLLLALAIGGLPFGLVVTVGWPLPTAIPTGAEVTQWIGSPLSDGTILKLLAIAAWLLWAALLHAIAAETRAAWRGIPLRPADDARPTNNPLRLAAATLITALTIGAVSTGAAAANTEPADATARPAAASHAAPPAKQRAALQEPALQGPATFHIGTTSHHTVVKRGDTLSRIAAQWLGDAARWPEICSLNWHRHWPKTGGTLADCDLIYPGWDLRLPPDATPPASAPTPPIAAPATPRSAPPAPQSPPPSPQTPTPAPPATPVPDDPDGVIPAPHSASPSTPTTSHHPTAAPTLEATSAPARTTRTEPPQRAEPAPQPDRATDSDGVTLPSGSFIPWALAAAITAAAALVWLQRRRRYQPGTRDDTELDELPAPVVQLQREVIRHRELPTHHDPAERATAVPRLPQLPPGGIGLTGDGAAAAARAALVSTLAAGGPHDPDRRGEVIIDGTTLTTLIGADAANLGQWPRLHVADDLDDALAFVDARLLHRARLLDEHSLTDLDSLRDRASDEEPLPPLLLITETPPPGARMHTRTTIGLGTNVDVAALLLGAWDHGTTLDVAADGTTRHVEGPTVDTPGERMAVIDTDATAAILHTLREAHTGEPPTDLMPDHSNATQPFTPPAPEGQSTEPDDEQPANDAAVADTQRGTTTQPKAQLRVLGQPRIDDVVLPGRPLRSKAAELAVYLACHPDGADTRQIGEYLAPESKLRQADQQVHTNASNLRHVLARAAGERKAAYVVKRSTSPKYRLDPNTVDVDLWQLRDLLTRAAVAANPVRTELLRDACALYTAPLADQCHYEWIEPHRERVRRWGSEAHLLLADELLATDPRAAIDLLTKAIDLDRYNEALYCKAMRARHALGEADGIRALLRAVTRALSDLNVGPEDATVDLASQLCGELEHQ